MAQDKKIEDFLHLYLGCEVEYDTYTGILLGVNKKYITVEISELGIAKIDKKDYKKIKLILRPLRYMTEQEDKDCFNIMFGEFASKFERKAIIHYEGEKVKYLLSKHFDLFSLIEEGLAIDKTTMK